MLSDRFRERTVKRRRYLSKTSIAKFEISSAASATRAERRVRDETVRRQVRIE